ncbi:MAG TPA: single-stranded DNA-binding protein [Clostridiales bacterium]|nr:single-stranded DNA-binding protein [Clostridiales bacterium]
MIPEDTNNSHQSNEEQEKQTRETNQVSLAGIIESSSVFSHEVYSEKFYILMLSIPRLSEQSDRIPVMYSERLLPDPGCLQPGKVISITGQFRSYNNISSIDSHKLMLTVFARDAHFLPEGEPLQGINSVFLDGYICKPPVYRMTPFGREIADILLAVNRSYNKSDYIPCIAWGRNARYCEKLKTGTNMRVWGRIQSRQYQKKTPDNETVVRTAYEVSIARLELP